MGDRTKFRVGQVVKVLWVGTPTEYLKIKKISLHRGWVDFTNGNCTTVKILQPQTDREIGPRPRRKKGGK